MADQHTTHHAAPHAEHHGAQGGIHKKLGPLEVWQWVAIGAAIGIVIYLRNRSSANAAAATPTATTSATDPNAGYQQGYTDGQAAAGQSGAGGGYTGGDGTTPADGGAPTSLQQELGDLANIEQLMAGFPPNNGPATTTGSQGPGKSTQIEKTLRNIDKQLAKLNKSRTTTHHGGSKNPGHTVTHHHNGAKTSSSTHHNAGHRSTHKTTATPSHQHHTSPKTKTQPARHRPVRRGP